MCSATGVGAPRTGRTGPRRCHGTLPVAVDQRRDVVQPWLVLNVGGRLAGDQLLRRVGIIDGVGSIDRPFTAIAGLACAIDASSRGVRSTASRGAAATAIVVSVDG